MSLQGDRGRRLRAFGATIVTCYAEPACTEEFRTASDPEVIDDQLRAAGWQVVADVRGAIYRCPMHSRVDVAKPTPLVYRGPAQTPGAR
jgi:hypothetical protein